MASDVFRGLSSCSPRIGSDIGIEREHISLRLGNVHKSGSLLYGTCHDRDLLEVVMRAADMQDSNVHGCWSSSISRLGTFHIKGRQHVDMERFIKTYIE
jgi:hypothetical protein